MFINTDLGLLKGHKELFEALGPVNTERLLGLLRFSFQNHVSFPALSESSETAFNHIDSLVEAYKLKGVRWCQMFLEERKLSTKDFLPLVEFIANENLKIYPDGNSAILIRSPKLPISTLAPTLETLTSILARGGHKVISENKNELHYFIVNNKSSNVHSMAKQYPNVLSESGINRFGAVIKMYLNEYSAFMRDYKVNPREMQETIKMLDFPKVFLSEYLDAAHKTLNMFEDGDGNKYKQTLPVSELISKTPNHTFRPVTELLDQAAQQVVSRFFNEKNFFNIEDTSGKCNLPTEGLDEAKIKEMAKQVLVNTSPFFKLSPKDLLVESHSVMKFCNAYVKPMLDQLCSDLSNVKNELAPHHFPSVAEVYKTLESNALLANKLLEVEFTSEVSEAISIVEKRRESTSLNESVLSPYDRRVTFEYASSSSILESIVSHFSQTGPHMLDKISLYANKQEGIFEVKGNTLSPVGNLTVKVEAKKTETASPITVGLVVESFGLEHIFEDRQVDLDVMPGKGENLIFKFEGYDHYLWNIAEVKYADSTDGVKATLCLNPLIDCNEKRISSDYVGLVMETADGKSKPFTELKNINTIPSLNETVELKFDEDTKIKKYLVVERKELPNQAFHGRMKYQITLEEVISK